MRNHHTEQLQEEIEKYIQKKWQGSHFQSILWIHKYPCAPRISSEYCEKNVASFICWSPVTWCLHKSCRLIILIHQPFYTTGLGSAPQSGPRLAAWHHINPDRWYCDTCDLYSRRVARHSSKSPSLSLWPGCRQRIFVAWILKCDQLGAEQRLVLARWSGQPALEFLNRSLIQ